MSAAIPSVESPGHRAEGGGDGAGPVRPRVRFGLFLGAGLAVAVALAFLVAPRASSSPDGLEHVATEEGFAEEAGDHALADAPTADYGISGLDHAALATGLAGLLGIVVTFGVAWGALTLVRRLQRIEPVSPPAGTKAAADATAGPAPRG